MTQTNWHDLSLSSHYQTALAVKKAIEDKDYEDAYLGIEELSEAMARAERREMASYLIRLMKHVIKWKYQPNKRSTSWVSSINHSRSEIELLQMAEPSLNKNYITTIWSNCFKLAARQAKAEIRADKRDDVEDLNWNEVFEEEYLIQDND